MVAASVGSCPHLSAPPSGPGSPTTTWSLGLPESPGRAGAGGGPRHWGRGGAAGPAWSDLVAGGTSVMGGHFGHCGAGQRCPYARPPALVGAPRGRTALLPGEAWLGLRARRAMFVGEMSDEVPSLPYSAQQWGLWRLELGGAVRGGVSPEASPNGCNVRQEPGPLLPCPPPLQPELDALRHPRFFAYLLGWPESELA